jgi:hypothetical protein
VCSASSFCNQPGDACLKGTDCCGGNCTILAGKLVGTCGDPPKGNANCNLSDGMLCAGSAQDGGVVINDGGLPACGGGCCSRLCAPYGPTGVLVCQPASGCHVVGDLCTQDGDCCGSVGLPGGSGKPVTCDIQPPFAVGICVNPQGCKPDGDVCKLANSSCNASCDCCSGNCENKDTCKPDSLGVPRCAAEQCVMAGGSCASSANCCNGMPCVPNPVDGGMPPYICSPVFCVQACGECTVNADCCPGETCIEQIGSAKGICGPCGGPDGGVGGGGAGGGMGGVGGGGAGGTDGGPCSLYGQECMSDSDCCNGVPCNGPNGPCMPGQIGCTCHTLTF